MSLHSTALPAAQAQGIEHGLAASAVAADKHDSVTTYASLQAFTHALASGAHGRHLNDVDGGPLRLVGFLVRREEVERALTILADVAAPIRRLHQTHPDGAPAHQGVEHEQSLGAAGAGGEGADDLHDGDLGLVLRPLSVAHLSLLRPPLDGHAVVLPVNAIGVTP